MDYRIKNEKVVYNGFFQLKEIDFYYTNSSGEEESQTMEEFERGDGVCAVIYEKDTDQYLFTRQFRLAARKSGDEVMVELVAGMIDGDEAPAETIKREIMEEIGYKVSADLEFLGDFYVSPGGTTERIFIFYTEVESSDQVGQAGGREDESEDIQLVKLGAGKLKDMMQENRIRDAKTMIGLQWKL